MKISIQIQDYIASLSHPKSNEVQELHGLIMEMNLGGKLWFLDGKDAAGKTVSNPNIGYGIQTLNYAGGKTKEFYQVGVSANTTGISVYIMGLKDKNFLKENYGNAIGKASITGYCIKFKTLKEINLEVLKSAIKKGLEPQQI